MSEAYLLLNVNYKKQPDVIEKVNQLSTVKSVKTVYGIYDVLVVLESDNLQEVKNDIDSNIYNMEGIENLTTLISVS
ncbi:MAG: Lrp/AsnC family transcriptional regulator [Nitrosopumilus sp.]|nr:Lrp/AsnC family transcriptional regulator [Nitrosopumilus sp.]